MGVIIAKGIGKVAFTLLLGAASAAGLVIGDKLVRKAIKKAEEKKAHGEHKSDIVVEIES